MIDVIFLDFDGVLTCVIQDYIMKQRRERLISLNKEYVLPDGTIKIPDRIMYHLEFSKQAISNLNWLCKQNHDIRIVVSSTWRIGTSVKELQDILVMGGFKHPKRVIGKTVRWFADKEGKRALKKEDIHQSIYRGYEIQEWLNNNEWRSFVILDDDSDMVHLMPYLIQMNGYDGLLYSQCQRALEMFKNFSKDEYLKIDKTII